MRRPNSDEYPAAYQSYIDLVRKDNVIRELGDQVMQVQGVISRIPEELEEFVYAPGKWTIKEVIGHIIDTERIQGYRALRFARKDKTPLPGFDENLYVANANFRDQSLYSLGHEFAIVREANLALFKVWKEEQLSETGVANNNNVSVRALLFVIAGHATHHLNVIRNKYLGEPL